jgi:archaellum component FlaF (FlaF/FlaG flagellin family)
MISGIIDSNQKIVTNGLILNLDAAQLRSYPTTGTTWTDLSGNGLNGTLISGATFDTANGGSIVFDGTDDFASINPAITLSNVSQFTYTSFVNFSTSVGNQGTFFSHGLNGQFTNDIMFYWEKLTNILSFQVNNGLDGSATYSYSAPSNWVNLCIVYNGSLSTNADKLKLYINGVQVTLNFNTYNVPSTTSTIASPQIRIGQYIGFASGFYYTGKIATTNLYNRALTATEVGQNFNAIKSRFGL